MRNLNKRLDRLQQDLPCPVCRGQDPMPEFRVIHVPDGQPEPPREADTDAAPSPCPGCGRLMKPKTINRIFGYDRLPTRRHDTQDTH